MDNNKILEYESIADKVEQEVEEHRKSLVDNFLKRELVGEKFFCGMNAPSIINEAIDNHYKIYLEHKIQVEASNRTLTILADFNQIPQSFRKKLSYKSDMFDEEAEMKIKDYFGLRAVFFIKIEGEIYRGFRRKYEIKD